MIGGNMKRTVSYLLFALSLASSAMQLHAQDLAHYKRVVKALSSAKYQGRGYAKGGANKAGKFLQKEYLKAGVDEVTVQPFIIDINTFCGIVENWLQTAIIIPLQSATCPVSFWKTRRVMPSNITIQSTTTGNTPSSTVTSPFYVW